MLITNSPVISLQKKFNDYLSVFLPTIEAPTTLKEACVYSLSSPGKRLRPILVMAMAEALGDHFDVLQPALVVELFHSASLIADDMPCMDNADLRRETPTLHKKFGETTALLASYGLLTLAFEKIHSSSQHLIKQKPSLVDSANEICAIALALASRCSGLQGATSGQYLDLFSVCKTKDSIYDVMYKKTGTLFEVSLLFGWLFGGGDLDKVPQVKKLANHFGNAFQIADDIDDLEKDKDLGGLMNIAYHLGIKETKKLFFTEVESFEKSLQALDISHNVFSEIKEKLLLAVKNS